MGLFDNLIKKGKDLINQVKKNIENDKNDTTSTTEPIENVKNIENKKSESKTKKDNVFSDEIIKKYYEVIFGMIKSIGDDFIKNEKISLIAKAYIEKQLNESCDEEKMQEALNLFKISKTGISSNSYYDKKTVFLRGYNEDLGKINNYLDNNFDIVNLCFQDEYKLIEKEYEEILETIKNQPKPSYFGQGINEKIYKKYKNTVGDELTELITSKIIYNSLVSGNIVVKSAMIGLVKTLFDVAINKVKGNDSVLPRFLVALSVRALHFEKTPNVASIEKSEYRELLLSHSYYKNKFGPFMPEDKISDEISYSINGYGGGEDLPLSLLSRIRYQIEGYDCIEGVLRLDNKIYNLICNLVWKDAIEDERTNDEGVNITNSQEVSDIFTILNQYFAEIYGCIILA